jgi:hypothetical protein
MSSLIPTNAYRSNIAGGYVDEPSGMQKRPRNPNSALFNGLMFISLVKTASLFCAHLPSAFKYLLVFVLTKKEIMPD